MRIGEEPAQGYRSRHAKDCGILSRGYSRPRPLTKTERSKSLYPTASNLCRDNRCADGIVREVDVAITISGSSQAFRSVDHHLADRNCAHALTEGPASGDGLAVRDFHYSAALHPSSLTR